MASSRRLIPRDPPPVVRHSIGPAAPADRASDCASDATVAGDLRRQLSTSVDDAPATAGVTATPRGATLHRRCRQFSEGLDHPSLERDRGAAAPTQGSTRRPVARRARPAIAVRTSMAAASHAAASILAEMTCDGRRRRRRVRSSATPASEAESPNRHRPRHGDRRCRRSVGVVSRATVARVRIMAMHRSRCRSSPSYRSARAVKGGTRVSTVLTILVLVETHSTARCLEDATPARQDPTDEATPGAPRL